MLKNMSIKIHMLETGNIRCRPSLLTQPPGNVLLRRARMLLDRRLLDEPLPIFAFLVEHPTEGNFLFDLGESPRCVEPGYFAWWQVAHRCATVSITPEQGLGAQLRRRGIDPDLPGAITAAVVSHLHDDHAGGLPDIYGRTTIYTSRAHWDAFRRPVYATLEGANPQAWPEGFAPTLLKADGPAVGPWPCSYPISRDGRIVAVDTPGHVPGHISLIIMDDDITYFLAGDATYSLDLLDKGLNDGVTADPDAAQESIRKIKEFCRTRDVVVLPSHEYASIKRLEAKELYRPSRIQKRQ